MTRWTFEPARAERISPRPRKLPVFEGDRREARLVAREHARKMFEPITMAPEDEPGDWEEISPDEDLGY